MVAPTRLTIDSGGIFDAAQPVAIYSPPLNGSLDGLDTTEKVLSLLASDRPGEFPFHRTLALFNLFVSALWPPEPITAEFNKENNSPQTYAPFVLCGIINFHCRTVDPERQFIVNGDVYRFSELVDRSDVERLNAAFLDQRGGLESLAVVPSATDFYLLLSARFNELWTSIDLLDYLVKAAHVFPKYATRNVAIKVIADNLFNRRHGYKPPLPSMAASTWTSRQRKLPSQLRQEAKLFMREPGRQRRIAHLEKLGISPREIFKSAETVKRDWDRAPETIALLHSLLNLMPCLLRDLLLPEFFLELQYHASIPSRSVVKAINQSKTLIEQANRRVSKVRAVRTPETHGTIWRPAFSDSEFDFLVRYLSEIRKRRLSEAEIAAAKLRNDQGLRG
jgi:hypothetical protein